MVMSPLTALAAELFPPSAQVFVRLHVEPHGKQEELEPGDDEQCDEDDGGARDLVPRDAEADLEPAEDEASAEEEHPQGVEEDEGMEVADDVFLLHPPEEALQKEPGDLRDDVAQADAAPLPYAVDWPRRVVAHAAVPDVQVDEQVVREAVALVDPVEVEELQRREVDRGVAGLRVGYVPVPRRDLRQEREHRVPEIAGARDQLPGLAGEEPVRLGVVDLVRRDALDERLEVVRVHLAIRRHHRGYLDLVGDRALVPGDDGRADSLVPLVRDEVDAWVGILDLRS